VDTLKKILVTGGAGFIGSHLCERLLDEGNHVICLDNFYTGNRKNVLHLMNHPHFVMEQHDVTTPIHLDVDEIYNLACPASPHHYQYDPIQTMKTNVIGVINLLELARKTRAKILQASTSEVYGDPLVHPQTEDYRGNVNITGPRACYDEGKRCAETLFFDYHRFHGVNIRVIRIFNTYGPRMNPNDGRVVSNFIVQALTGKPLTVYGDGSQTRSFCYIDDLVEGMIRMMNGPDHNVGPINLGNPEEVTIHDLARMVIDLSGSSSVISYKPLPVDDPVKRRPDVTLAKERLQWSPKTKLQDGLRKTISYFKNILFQDEQQLNDWGEAKTK
jgi:UDP-glucuronate decarboxylase